MEIKDEIFSRFSLRSWNFLLFFVCKKESKLFESSIENKRDQRSNMNQQLAKTTPNKATKPNQQKQNPPKINTNPTLPKISKREQTEEILPKPSPAPQQTQNALAPLWTPKDFEIAASF